MTKPRVLVTCFPQSGHLHPLIPIVRALADGGGTVLFATSASQHGVLAAAGLTTADLGPTHEETAARMDGAVMAEAFAAVADADLRGAAAAVQAVIAAMPDATSAADAILAWLGTRPGAD